MLEDVEVGSIALLGDADTYRDAVRLSRLAWCALAVGTGQAVLDYVVAHEIGHLAEMNHSPDFWAVVEGLCPDHEASRDWLRTEGAGLHRLRLG